MSGIYFVNASQIIFVKVRRAAGTAAFIFCIAPPNDPAVFTVGMPDLGAEDFSTISADDFACKGTVAIGAPGAVLASSQFQLHLLSFLRINNGCVAVFHIVLGDLSFVDLHLFL